ncbi:MAG: GNAT family N-acetyltransferase [Streptococcaceae bacterium]|jgi:predicted acetyltransferase|nr:GNAT family N-acetyltransferase [Streptococcaceae bacterium]
MKRRELTECDDANYSTFKAAWQADTNPYKYLWLLTEMEKRDFPDFLEFLASQKSLEDSGYSASTAYFALVGGELAGVLHARWDITKGKLLETGGHIAYYVAPSFRGQGLAAQMVQEILPEYRARGIQEVWIMCKEENVASRKTIEACGGLYVNSVGNERRYHVL